MPVMKKLHEITGSLRHKEHSFLLPSQETTVLAGKALAQILTPGMFVALWGDLGTGKTALARAIIQNLNPDETDIPSPTFTLIQEYEGSAGRIFHFDLYRLSSSDEVYELGWEEARQGICIVEWPDRLGSLLPPMRIDIRMDYHRDDENARTMTLQALPEIVDTFIAAFESALKQ